MIMTACLPLEIAYLVNYILFPSHVHNIPIGHKLLEYQNCQLCIKMSVEFTESIRASSMWKSVSPICKVKYIVDSQLFYWT